MVAYSPYGLIGESALIIGSEKMSLLLTKEMPTENPGVQPVLKFAEEKDNHSSFLLGACNLVGDKYT